jgi:integrase
MGRSRMNLSYFISTKIHAMKSYGESKHDFKADTRKAYELKNGTTKGYNPAKANDKIFGKGTTLTYQEASVPFIKHCKEIGINKADQMTREVAAQYLKERRDLWKPDTLSRDMSFLNKVFKYEFTKKELGLKNRSVKNVTRARTHTNPNAAVYKNNIDEIKVCKATGCRRQTIDIIEYKDFIWQNGQPVAAWLRGEKGGKTRLNPILPEDRDVMKELLGRKNKEGKMFEEWKGRVKAHIYKRDYRESFGKHIQTEYSRTKGFDLKGYDCSYMNHLKEEDLKGPNKRYGYDKEVAGVIAVALGHERIDSLKSYAWDAED